MAYIVRLGPEYFPDASRNRPIRYGRIYIGLADTDPTIEANQQDVTALLEDGSEISMSQPILTSAGGIPIYNGSPVALKVASRYSITVLNQSGSQEYYIPINFAADDTEITISATGLSADDGIEIVVNDAGLDCDFRVESTISQCGLFLEASSGNVGINYCDLDAWEGGYTGVQIRETGNVSASSSTLNITQNAFRGSSWTYQTSNQASRYSQGLGIHFFQTAAVGTEETAISWINQLTLTATEANFNDDGEDIDFRIESDTRPYAFLLDGESGNVAFSNDTLADWGVSYPAIQIGNNVALMGGTGTAFMLLSNNVYFTGFEFRYIEDGVAAAYMHDFGTHNFYSAVSGLANDSVSLQTFMTLSTDSVVINESGANVDFRIETDNDTDAFTIDGGSGNVAFSIDGNARLNMTASSMIFNEAGIDVDYRFETSLDPSAIFIDGGTGEITFSNINELLSLNSTNIAFNGNNADIDFRVSSDTRPYALNIDGASGNVGINRSTFESWNWTFTVLQIGTNASIAVDAIADPNYKIHILENAYYNGSQNWVRQDGGEASRYTQYYGNHYFYVAESDVADSVISWINYIKFGTSETIFNENGDNIDFRVESDTNTTAIYMAGSTGNIGFGVSDFGGGSGGVIGLSAVTAPSSDPASGALLFYDTADDILKCRDYNGEITELAPGGGGGSIPQGIDIVFNEAGGDYDFRIESDTVEYAFFLDGETGTISLGNSTIENWDSTFTALQIGGNASLLTETTQAGSNNFYTVQNAYYDSADWRYQSSSKASLYQQNDGEHTFYTDGGLVITEVTTLTAADAQANDYYGIGPAINSDGTILVVGASAEDTAATDAGKVYTYNWNGGTSSWDEVVSARLTAADAQNGDQFGTACSMNDAGTFLVVGAMAEGTAASGAGKVYTYTWNGGTSSWDETVSARLTAADAQVDDRFGAGLSLNSDGTILVVGAFAEDTAATDAGKVYTYNWNSGTSSWDEITAARLTASDYEADGYFGRSCSLDYDGEKLVVGADRDDSAASNAGKVYTYEWNSGTTSWDEIDQFTASDAQADDRFGSGCSMNGDGTLLFVGASAEDTAASNAGKIYVYNWNIGTSSWDEAYQLTSSDAASNDGFGYCQVSSDGTTLVIGAWGAATDFGKVYSYSMSGTTASDAIIAWINQLSLKSDEIVINDGSNDLNFRIESDINANALLLEGSSSNLGLGITTFGGGTGGILALSNATAPTSNPTGGGLIWVDSGNNDLYYRKASGDVSKLNYPIYYSIGNVGSGTATPDLDNGNVQYINCTGSFTLANPTNIPTSPTEVTIIIDKNNFDDYITFGSDYLGILDLNYRQIVIKMLYVSGSIVKAWQENLDEGIAKLTSDTWNERTTALTPSDAGAGDRFGISCTLSGNGTVLAVGAINWDGVAGADQGAVYIFDWDKSSWNERTTALTPSDAGAGDQFGGSCAFSEDGTVLAVGAKFWDGGAGADQGAVYIFDWTGSAWNERTTALTPSDAGAGDRFGVSCALSDDGSILSVGANSWDGVAGSGQGAVYIFDWTGSAWNERTTALTPSDAGAGDNFGSGCSLSGNGSILAVGANSWDDATDQGAVYIFDWNGSSWSERTTALVASDAEATDFFGDSCSLSNNGATLAVGAFGWDGGAGGQGTIYIFDWNGSSWNERTNITTSDFGLDDYFGVGCALSSDGSILVGGAYSWDGGAGTDQGAVYIFDLVDYIGSVNQIPSIKKYITDFDSFSGTASGDVVFNESGGDYDFRVETDTEQYALFVEGSSGNVGIGMNSFGGGVGILAITNAAAPSTDPLAGGFIWVDNGDSNLYYRDANSNVVNLSVFSGTDSGNIVFNESGGDYDFRVESDTITNAIYMDGATGIVSLPACYSHDMNGETYRDLLINDSGELGYDSSTIRKKTNVVDMENIDWVYDLRPVNFEYKKRDDKGAYLNKGNGIKKYGLIAEELESVNSDFVFYDEDGRTEGIHYREFIPVLIKALQDQKYEIERLKMRLTEVE